MSPGDFKPSLNVDADVRLQECDVDLAQWVERMSPHGLGNAEPVFRVQGVTVDQASAVGNGRHLKLRVRDQTGRADAIGFGMGDRLAEITQAGRCDLAFAPMQNEWMGQTRIQLKLKGVRVS
jgi:single-stranded-DNA-specific exonuclease